MPPPSAPTNVKIVKTNISGSVSITWTSSVSGDATISNYSITSVPSSGITFSSIELNSATANGLVGGTIYVFSVICQSNNGNSTPGISTPFTYTTLPDAPSNFSGTPGDGSINLSWTPSVTSGGLLISGYVITTSPVTKTTKILPGTYSTVLSGLKNGTSYQFIIIQNNILGSSQPSYITLTPVGPPGVPTNIKVVNGPSAGTAVISWTDPFTDASAPITGYDIQSYPGSCRFSQPFSNPTTVYGVTSNTVYIFIVSTLNSAGSSIGGVSPIFIYTSIPDPPTGVSASAGIGNATISWTPQTMSGGLPIKGYIVTSSPATTTVKVPQGKYSTIISSLISGTSYTFTVVSYNTLGNSTGTISNSITPSNFPDPPTKITVVNGSPVVISWTAPISDGGSAITQYDIVSIPSGPTFIGSDTSTTRNISGLVIGTTYIFTVSSVNSLGSSISVGVSPGFTYTSVPSPPTGIMAVAGPSNATVSWTPLSSDGGLSITGYIISSNPVTKLYTAIAGSSSLTIPSLINGIPYTFNIIAKNANGSSNLSIASNSVIPQGPPNPPIKIQATAGNGLAFVSWIAPNLTGGLPITGYIITANPSGESQTVGNIVSGTFNNLSNGSPYTFNVKSVNSLGSSINSATSASITPLDNITTPDQATLLTAIGSSGEIIPSITITFKAPTVTGNSVITNYQYSTDDGLTYTPFNPKYKTSPATIKYLSTDGTRPLVNGTSYTVRIKAANSMGPSTIASESLIARPISLVPSTPISIVATPENRNCTISFNVLSTGGSPITNYQYSTDGGITYLAFRTPQTTSPITISTLSSDTSLDGLTPLNGTPLVNGTTYNIRIKAINAIGSSPASSSVALTNPPSEPDPPVLGTTTPGNASIAVAFTAGLNQGSDILNYLYSINTSVFTSFNPPQTTSPFNIVNPSLITNGNTYTVRVKAANINGTSVSSNSVSVTLPAIVPDAPTILSATPGNNTMSITFTPGSSQGSPITNYKYSTDAGSTFHIMNPAYVSGPIVISTISSNGTTPLLNGTTYSVKIQAINSVGSSSSAAISVSLPATVPDAPTIVSVTPSTGAITVTFTPGLAEGSAVTNYSYSTDSGATFFALSPAYVSSKPIVITRLSQDGTTLLRSGNTYNIQIREINGIGPSLPAIWPSAITLLSSSLPNPPTINSVTSTSGYISVVFTPDSADTGPVLNYSYSTDGGSTFFALSPTYVSGDIVITKISSDGTTALTNGSTYTVHIRAINSIGSSTSAVWPSPVILSSSSLPDPPTALSAIVSNNTIFVSFTPGQTGGSQVTNYRYSTDGGTTFFVLSPAQTTSPINITGLSTDGIAAFTIGTTYSIILCTITENGTSVASNPLSVTTNLPGPLSPPTITNVTYSDVTDTGYGDMSINFSISYIPGSLGGSTLRNYAISLDGGITYIYPLETYEYDTNNLHNTNPIIYNYNSRTNSSFNFVLMAQTFKGVSEPSNIFNIIVPPTYTTYAPQAGSAILIASPGIPSYVLPSITICDRYLSTRTYILAYFDRGSPITNFAFSTDNVTYLDFDPPQFGPIFTIPSRSNGSPFSNNTNYVIRLRMKNSNGYTNIGTFVSVTINNLYHTPDPPIINSIITSSDDFTVTNNFYSKISFYINTDTIMLRSYLLFLFNTLYQPSVMMGTAYLNNQTNNFIIKDSSYIMSYDFLGNNFNLVTQNDLNIFSLPSNSLFNGFTWGPRIVSVNYTQTDLILNMYCPFSATDDNETYFLSPYDQYIIKSNNNIIYVSLDGGVNFTQLSETTSGTSCISIGNLCSVGSTYDLVMKYGFLDSYGIPYMSEPSNTITFTYGTPKIQLEFNGITTALLTVNGTESSYTVFDFNFIPLCDGGATKSEITPRGLPDNPTFEISFDNGSTFTDITTYILDTYIYCLNNVNLTVNLTSFNINSSISRVSSIIKFTSEYYDSSGSIISIVPGQYNIKLKYNYGTSNSIVYSSIVVAIAPAPVILSATSDSKAIYVTFTPPDNLYGNTIINYKYSTDGGSSFSLFDPIQTQGQLVIKVESDGITPLSPLTNYTICIQAILTMGCSLISNTYIAPEIPFEITRVRCVSNYVYIYTNSTPPITIKNTVTNVTTIVGTSLKNNIGYRIAISNCTPGVLNTVQMGITNEFPFIPYNAPTAPFITSVISNTTTLTIIPQSTGPGNPPILYYYFSTDGFITKTRCDVDSSGNIPISLAAGKTYKVQLQAVTDGGRSASSNTQSVTT
jgi:hypothetical protein